MEGNNQDLLEKNTPESSPEDSSTETKIAVDSLEPKENLDYDFLKTEKRSVNNDDLITTQFDTAFKKSSPVIQTYILSEQFEENIRLICKIEKLAEEKALIILENITVSILVGLLPISEAKDTMIESFRSSGIILESFSASMIMKSIDTYILSDIRKQILESKLDEKREIRHLTLKEKRSEANKEELRKILLEKTGNLDGRGQPFIEYKSRALNKPPIKESTTPKNDFSAETKKPELNRDALLTKLNLNNITDTKKMLERMKEIQEAESKRVANPQLSASVPITLSEKSGEETAKRKNVTSDNLADMLKEKLAAEEDLNTNLDTLREERGIQEAQLERAKTLTLPVAKSASTETQKDYANFDPYREIVS